MVHAHSKFDNRTMYKTKGAELAGIMPPAAVQQMIKIQQLASSCGATQQSIRETTSRNNASTYEQ